jgi:hypothetical protein
MLPYPIMAVCLCVDSTSGGEETLATPAYQGWLVCIPLPLGAAVNKIEGATLTPPNAQARALRVSASPAPGIGVQLVSGSIAQLPSSSSSSTIAGSVVCMEGGRRPLSLAKSKYWLISPKRSNWRTPLPHRSRTKFPDWSIYNEICHSLSTYAHIMGNQLQTGFFQHIHQARVQP